MNRLFSVVLLLLLSIVLVACLGNDREASDLENNEDTTVNDESNQEKNDDGSEVDTDPADAEVADPEEVVAENNDESNAMSAGECIEQDHSEIFEDIGAGVSEVIGVELFIPDCAIRDGGQESTPPGRWIEYYFKIDNTDFQSVYNAYNDLLPDKYDEEHSNIRLDQKHAHFVFLHDEEDSSDYTSYQLMEIAGDVNLKIVHFYLID